MILLDKKTYTDEDIILCKLAEEYLGDKIFDFEYDEAKQSATHKLFNCIIPHDGDLNGTRRESWYLAKLIQEAVVQNRLFEYCKWNFHGTSTEQNGNSTVPNSTLQYSTNKDKDSRTATADTSKQQTTIKQQFDEFWQIYPNKKSKQNAINAWGKIKPDEALFTRIIKAVHEQSKSEEWCKESGRFIPHPSTWLNGKRWEDIINPTANAPPQIFKPSTGGRSLDEYRNT